MDAVENASSSSSMTSGSKDTSIGLTSSSEESSIDLSCPPDRGLRAWLVVAGAFLSYFATFGLLNSYGTFQAIYQERMLPNQSPTAISWIGSVQVFLLFIGGTIFGPIFDLYGSRVLLFPGTFLYVVSLVFTSFATQYYHLLLAQGIVYGLGNSMLFYPTISSIPHWFRRRHGLAIGIVMSGSSLGGITWPLIIQRLYQTVGLAWTCRIVGLICLLLLTGPCFMITLRTHSGRVRGPRTGLTLDHLKGLFKDSRFTLLAAGMFFVFWGMFNPFYNLPLYGLKHGMSFTMSNSLLAILNAGSFFGRIGSGILADKLGRFYVTGGCAFLSGLLVFCLHGIKTPAGIIAFSVLFGATSGGLISLQSSCMAEITERMDVIGVNIGVMMTICSLAALTGNPLSTAFTTRGNFDGFIYFSGVTLLVGSVLLILSRLVAIKRQSANLLPANG